jgi:hypothetical protein
MLFVISRFFVIYAELKSWDCLNIEKLLISSWMNFHSGISSFDIISAAKGHIYNLPTGTRLSEKTHKIANLIFMVHIFPHFLFQYIN